MPHNTFLQWQGLRSTGKDGFVGIVGYLSISPLHPAQWAHIFILVYIITCVLWGEMISTLTLDWLNPISPFHSQAKVSGSGLHMTYRDQSKWISGLLLRILWPGFSSSSAGCQKKSFCHLREVTSRWSQQMGETHTGGVAEKWGRSSWIKLTLNFSYINTWDRKSVV